jgi:hypothetical protein
MTANLPARVDVIQKALPLNLVIPGAAIAEEVVKYVTEANKALAVAERAEIKDSDTAGRAADVLRAITTSEKKVDELRKEKTRPLDDQKEKITNLYKTALETFTKAKTLLSKKADVWRKAEEARLTAEAEERRKARQAEADRLAAAQASLGDDEGAQQILEEAAALPVERERVAAVGVYGSTLGTVNRNIGAVNDRRKFLQVLIAAKDPLLVQILEKIEFPQALLNKLAAAVNKGETFGPIGFEAKKDDRTGVR